MRAILEPDPHHGPGYAIIELHDAPLLESPLVCLVRISDGAWLSRGGWNKNETSFSPDDWNSQDDIQQLMLGPGIVDNLDSGESYTLSIPGAGSCALAIGSLIQSHIIGGEGVGLAPPPPPGFKPITSDDIPIADQKNAINEGVEPTPEIVDAIGLKNSSSSEATPASNNSPKPRNGFGCALTGVIIFSVWLAIAVGLWHGAMKSPPKPVANADTDEGDKEPLFTLFLRNEPDGAPTYDEGNQSPSLEKK